LNAVGGDLITRAESEKSEELKKKELTDAQGYLKQALEIHPNYKLSYLLLGNSYYHLGDLDQAITYFRHVLKIDPDYVEGKRNLGVALRDEGKIQGEKMNNLQGAITLLEEALTYLPNDFETFHLLGVAYGQSGDTQKAIYFFKKEIEQVPKNATAYYNLGIAYHQIGDTTNAKINFDKAKSLDPNLPQLDR
jgi:tetratricopeptide (TPR) repeat protein